jgi:hypothetical protein
MCCDLRKAVNWRDNDAAVPLGSISSSQEREEQLEIDENGCKEREVRVCLGEWLLCLLISSMMHHFTIH